MRFCEFINTRNPYEVTAMFEKEVNNLGCQLLTHNYDYLTLLGYEPYRIREHFRMGHIGIVKQRVEESIFKCTIPCKDFAISGEDEPIELYERMADARRKGFLDELFEDMPVEDLTRFKSEKTPVMIEEKYEIETPYKPKEASEYKKDF
jgi:hypothetical protein